jgi:Cu/Ag efflux protein CusF
MLAWAGAVLLSGLSARADQLAGTVKSVDLDGRKLVVAEQTTDKNIDVSVTSQTTIVTEGGQPLSLKYLKRGDGVGISLVNGTAATILVNQAPLFGVVTTIDVDGKSLVVTEKGTDREIQVAIKPQTTIETTKGKVSALKDLKTGDGLSITFAGDEARKVLVNVKPAELTAHVKSVAADLNSLIVTEIGSKTDVKVAVTPQTTIVTSEGKTMELKELKKGDGVGIAHEGSVASKIVVNVAPAR